MCAFDEDEIGVASLEGRRSQRPSVIHVLWSLSPGGAERAIYQLIREQRRRGYRSDAVVASTPGAYGERLSEEGVTVHELGQRHALDRRGVNALDPLLGEYDITHFHGMEPLLIRAAVARSGRP